MLRFLFFMLPVHSMPHMYYSKRSWKLFDVQRCAQKSQTSWRARTKYILTVQIVSHCCPKTGNDRSQWLAQAHCPNTLFYTILFIAKSISEKLKSTTPLLLPHPQVKSDVTTIKTKKRLVSVMGRDSSFSKKSDGYAAV